MLLSFFSNLIIVPIRNLLEVFFYFFNKISNTGLAVIGLSFVVTICCLPLYIIAEQWQEKERAVQKRLAPGIARIKQAFKKDEQYMMLSTYYRQNHYHPIMELRSSFSILIQIPFFIAAYTFLSHLDALKGTSFLFIRDMGEPDQILKIGSFGVNILPIAMTAINMVSGAIYSKGHGAKEKVQLYATAAIFLLLLYNSPAGLVLYWTMNNVLSLVKNIFYKLRHPLKVFYVLSFFALALLALWAVVHHRNLKTYYIGALVFAAVFVALIPLILKGVLWFIDTCLTVLKAHPSVRLGIFVLSALLLAVAAGYTIPSTIIDSSSSDYFYIDAYKTPLPFLFISLTQAMGLFFVWPLCLYALFPQRVKDGLTFLWVCAAFVGLANCFAFSGNYGLMDIEFSLMDEAQSFLLPPLGMLLNTICTVGIVATLIILVQKRPTIITSAAGILLVALIGFSVRNTASILHNFRGFTPPEKAGKPEPKFSLSKTGKNVIVIMEDRAVSALLDEAFSELPQLEDYYQGFTYYPNTVSMSHYTTLGAPGLFGGYDFTPWEINKRTDLTIREKHNQSLLVMPALFTDAGYQVTVTNLPYENYNMQPMEQIYKKYPNVKRVVTQGMYSDYWYEDHKLEKQPFQSFLLKKNMLYFSLFKLAHPLFRVVVYGCGFRLTGNPYKTTAYLIDAYAPLAYLDDLFSFDAEQNSFVLFDNELTHVFSYLQAPDYEPAFPVTNFGEGKFAHEKTYHSLCAALLRWGEFFQYLKENDCYDNTRIVLVSDHGNGAPSGKFHTQGFAEPKEALQALLLVKDFGEEGTLKEDMTFMTNADTPTIALSGILDHPKNPFTGNDMQVANKQDYVKISVAPMQSLRTRDDTAYTVSDNEWVTVHDNIFEDDNWSYLFPQKNEAPQ